MCTPKPSSHQNAAYYLPSERFLLPLPVSSLPSPPRLPQRQPLDFFSSYISFPILELRARVCTHDSIYVKLLSVITLIPPCCVYQVYSFRPLSPIPVNTYATFYSCLDGRLGCLWVLVITNKATVAVHEQTCL